MIEKIVSVSNVGKLRRHDAKGDQTLRKLTIIYGDNAIGKTTLAAVLDSLREGSPEVLLGRRTLGSKAEPAATIRTSEGMRAFAHGAWDSGYQRLEVFYSDFVSRNVFSGDQVSNDQQKGLCSLLVGRAAVAEGRRLQELRTAFNTANTRMLQLDRAIKSHIHGSMSLADFLALPVMEGLDNLVASATLKLDAAKDPATVLSKVVPASTELPSPDGEKLLKVLGTSIDGISTDTVARVTAWCAERMDDAGEVWLRQGMGYVAEGRCPFCDQSLDASAFFVVLKQYFSEAYTRYEGELAANLAVLQRQFDPAEFELAAINVQHQGAVATAWAGQVTSLDARALSADLSAAVHEGIEACTAVRRILSTKEKNPLRAIDASSLEPHLRSLDQALAALQAVEARVETAIKDIFAFRQSVQDSNPETLHQELDKLQNHRTRHDGSVAPLCTEYLGLVEKKKRIANEERAAKTRMEQNTETLLTKYRNEMNGYLEHFGSVVRIENTRTNHQTKPPSVEYSLNIDGISVPVGRPATRSDVPWFGNTLCEGEKNLFALSLFLAHVKNRTDLKDVVVVMDDPVNSLDQERRLMIADTLVSMLDELAQVIVLTHEPRLAYILYRSQGADQCKMLCIRKENGSSCVREWDSMDRDVATDSFRNYFTIADFLQGQSVNWEAAARSLRPFLEDYLRQRFPSDFGHDEWLGAMADRIDDAAVDHRLAALKPKLGDIRLVANATNPTHHGSTHSPGTERLNATSTELYAKKALNVVC